jgi:hypothetical protein
MYNILFCKIRIEISIYININCSFKYSGEYTNDEYNFTQFTEKLNALHDNHDAPQYYNNHEMSLTYGT